MSIDERVRDVLITAGSDVEPVAPDPAAQVLHRAARRRHRGVALSAIAGAAVLATIAGVVVLLTTTTQPTQPPAISERTTIRSLLARPLHLTRLTSGQPCPTTAGEQVTTSTFGGVALGDGPVRVLLTDRGDLRHGRVNLTKTQNQLGRHSRWLALETLWFSTPHYQGPFVVRGRALSGAAQIEVQPGSTGEQPGTGPLVVPSGPTPNTDTSGLRSVPGSTWITAPGCYAWQIDGDNFSDIITFDAR
jgi:hypothetical protein